VLAIVASSMAYGLVGERQRSETHVDALSALQATQYMVFADLEKNMRTNLCSMPAKYNEDFGIDDIDSYAQKQLMTISRIGVDG